AVRRALDGLALLDPAGVGLVALAGDLVDLRHGDLRPPALDEGVALRGELLVGFRGRARLPAVLLLAARAPVARALGADLAALLTRDRARLGQHRRAIVGRLHHRARADAPLGQKVVEQ